MCVEDFSKFLRYSKQFDMKSSEKSKSINSRGYSFGLIGYPLGHSYSPIIHESALNALDLNGQYLLYLVKPTSKADELLQDLLNRIRSYEIMGLNVTIPHKQRVIPFLDMLTTTAEAVGAVNTIYCEDGRLIGDNTDVGGFWVDLQKILQTTEKKDNKKAIVLGAGGSARAVVYSLIKNEFQVTIASRRIEQAIELCEQFDIYQEYLSYCALTNEFSTSEDYSLIVNATPVGMHPQKGKSPWPKDMPFPSGCVVYDLVYNPQKTMLIKQAEGAGVPCSSGLGMLVEQAALSFEKWTKIEAPRNAIYYAITNQINGNTREDNF